MPDTEASFQSEILSRNAFETIGLIFNEARSKPAPPETDELILFVPAIRKVALN